MPVCLCVLSNISKTTQPNLTKFSVGVSRSFYGGVVMLCTSGFVDEVMTSYNGSQGGATLQCRERDIALLHGIDCVLSCRRRALSLDESIVHGPGVASGVCDTPLPCLEAVKSRDFSCKTDDDESWQKSSRNKTRLLIGRPYYRSSLWYSVSSVVCRLSSVCLSSVTFCIVAKRCVVAKKCLKE